MKNVLLAVLAAFLTAELTAQDISFSQMGNNNLNLFYIDLVGKTAALKGDWGLFGGMRAGYNINQNVSVGLVAHGLIPDKLGSSYVNKEGRDELHLGYGGLEASYKYDLSDKFFLTGIMMLGAGRVDYENSGGNDYFFITEPGVSVNYMITRFFGLGYSLNYRLASGVNYADLSNSGLSGWAMDLSFKFGF